MKSLDLKRQVDLLQLEQIALAERILSLVKDEARFAGTQSMATVQSLCKELSNSTKDLYNLVSQ